ncbi:MAG: hypothetical protein U5K71_12590 [Gracilimonas sp.]|nr:hypothetical protein [Gracilimonas sp.]
MRSSVFTFLSVLLLSILTSCSLFNNDTQVEKRIALYFQAQNIGDTLSYQQDSLVVTDFKFSVDRFAVAGNDIELESSPGINTFLFTYDLNANDDRLVIDVGLGIADNFTFNSYSMFIEPVPENAGILDDDFFGEENNYSMVIKGSYNRKNFNFRISPTLDRSFTFEPVTLSDIDETLLLSKTIDLNDVFLNPDGSILDPTDETNSTIIIERVRTFLEVEGVAVNYY